MSIARASSWNLLWFVHYCRRSRDKLKTASHRRHDTVAAVVERRCLEGSVLLLDRGTNDDVHARLELVLVAGDVAHDHGLRSDDDLLLVDLVALLVLDRDHLPVGRGDGCLDGGVGHQAAGRDIPGP